MRRADLLEYGEPIRSGGSDVVLSIQAAIEGIGTLTHTVVGEDMVPSDLSGAQLPPTRSYRR